MVKFKKALITGATSGIGEALVYLLASKNIPLILTGRNKEKLIEMKEKLGGLVPVEVAAVDLLLKEERKIIVQLIYEHRVDLMVNNAGFGLYGSIVSQETQELLDIIEVDAASVAELTIEAAKSMKKNKQLGVIMNISSAAAFHILPNMAVYSASKAFVNLFSETVDFELKKEGVRVLAACPGKVATSFQIRASKGRKSSKRDYLYMTPEFAAEQIWRQIMKERPVYIFDWRYRVSTYLSRFLPKSLVVKLSILFMRNE